MTIKIDSSVRYMRKALAKIKRPLWFAHWLADDPYGDEQDAFEGFVCAADDHLVQGAVDSHILDLLGDASFRDYLWHVSQHEMLPVRNPKKLLNGTHTHEGAYWRLSDTAANMFNLSRVRLFAMARGLSVVQLLNTWANYLLWDGSHGVFAEYRNFTDMWSSTRIPAAYRDNLFLEVIYNYVRERIDNSSVPSA
jgi:hypothetical protein